MLKVDSSNMKEVYYKPGEVRQENLGDFGDTIKEDRNALDLLFQIMLELGTPLSAKIEVKEIAGYTVYVVAEGYMMACFADHVSENLIKEIAERQPCYAIFREKGLRSDSDRINMDQIFEGLSPETKRRVL